MYKKVFISHSKNDPNLDFFHKVFSGPATESVWMEFEEINPPPYADIMDKLNECDAVFVLLSNYLTSKPHTHSWVSFEIGLAANRNLDVFVFEPFNNFINFTVPYCTHYMIYSNYTEHIKFIKKVIENPSGYGLITQCQHNDCMLTFKLLIHTEKFVCPSCRRNTVYQPPQQIYVDDDIDYDVL